MDIFVIIKLLRIIKIINRGIKVVMASIIVCWIVAIMLIILSLFLFFGKGSFLIAGYNTSSKEKKSRYNERRLCFVVCCGMFILAIFLGLAAYYRFEMPSAISWIIPWGIIGTLVVVIILANTLCRNNHK